MSRRGPCIIIAAALAAAACALPSADEFARGPADAGAVADADAEIDAAPVVPGTTDASDAGPPVENLVAGTTSTFENGTCGDNQFFQSKGDAVKTAHTGQWACRTCRAGTDKESYSLNPQQLVQHPPIGAVYRASAWLRPATPGDLSQTVAIAIRLRNDTPSYQEVESAYGDNTPLTDTWRKLEVSLTVTKDAESLDAYVFANAPKDGTERCFLTDDFIVWRER